MLDSIVIWFNFIIALSTGAFSIAANLRPNAFSRSTTPSDGEYFYARMYALRAIPLALLAAYAPFVGGSLAIWILAGAFAAQIGDAALGVTRREIGMMVGPGIAATAHGSAALLLLTQPT